MARRIPRYLIRQFWITLGFSTLFAILIALGENAKGWDGLTYVILALGVAALWVLTSAVYMIWIIVRESARRPSWPAIGELVVLVSLAGLFLLWVDAH